MPELDKVIKGLERCRYSLKSHCDGCPYVYEDLCSTNDCTADLASDAFALLKENETVVRCKDCVKRPDEHETELNGKLHRYCELHRRWTTDDWFCADGERK